MVLYQAVNYGLKAYDHYKKYGPYYKAAYAAGTGAYQMAKKYTGKRKRKITSNGPNKAATKRAKTWGMSSSAYKRKDFKKGRARGKGSYNVEGTGSTFKKIQYKTTKLNKFSSFIGGEFVQQTQAFAQMFHNSTDEVNSQTVQYLTTVYEQPDVLNIFNQAYQNIPAIAPIDGAAPGPISVGTGVQPGSSSYKFYMNGVKLDITGTNMSAGGVSLKLYTIVSKNTKTSSAHPFNDWEVGLDDASGILGKDKVNARRVGSSPTESKVFNMNYRIVDLKKYELGPGGKIHHTFVFNPRSLVDTEYWARNTYVRGFTMWIMAVGVGQVGLVDASNVTYSGQPMLKSVNMAFNVVKTYRSKAVQHFPRSRIEYYTLPTVTVAAAGPVNIREDDGELEQ